MPFYKEHLMGGFASGMIVLFFIANYVCCYTIPILTTLEWLLFALAGSLFPDVDIKSKGQKLFYWVIVALILIALYKGNLNLAIYLSLFSILPMLVRHRGLFHCTWFIVLLPLGAAALASVYLPPIYRHSLFYDASFFIAGALSHLLMDFGPKGFIKMR